jgi:hypothetical protein
MLMVSVADSAAPNDDVAIIVHITAGHPRAPPAVAVAEIKSKSASVPSATPILVIPTIPPPLVPIAAIPVAPFATAVPIAPHVPVAIVTLCLGR